VARRRFARGCGIDPRRGPGRGVGDHAAGRGQRLAQHQLAVLATGRKDGSPQVSHVVYDWNGRDLVMSVKSFTAKWKNALRQPRVGLLVHEGRKQLVLYGRAEGIADDPERTDLTLRVFRRLTSKPDLQADEAFVKTLDEQERTVLRFVPEKAHMND
jgi:PPOX class probable F420-dependent enzyme